MNEQNLTSVDDTAGHIRMRRDAAPQTGEKIRTRQRKEDAAGEGDDDTQGHIRL